MFVYGCLRVHVVWVIELLMNLTRNQDINQLKKTMQLTGTPGPELLAKIKSDEVCSVLTAQAACESQFCPSFCLSHVCFVTKPNSTQKSNHSSFLFTVRAYARAVLGVVILSVCLSVYPSVCLLYTSPSPRDRTRSRMPSSA